MKCVIFVEITITQEKKSYMNTNYGQCTLFLQEHYIISRTEQIRCCVAIEKNVAHMAKHYIQTCYIHLKL